MHFVNVNVAEYVIVMLCIFSSIGYNVGHYGRRTGLESGRRWWRQPLQYWRWPYSGITQRPLQPASTAAAAAAADDDVIGDHGTVAGASSLDVATAAAATAAAHSARIANGHSAAASAVASPSSGYGQSNAARFASERRT